MEDTVDYSYLLRNGDKIRSLLPIQRSELLNYISVCKLSNRGGIYAFWEEIKNNWVTDGMDTIWQLTSRLFEIKYNEVLNIKFPPLSLIQWILDNDANINPL